MNNDSLYGENDTPREIVSIYKKFIYSDSSGYDAIIRELDNLEEIYGKSQELFALRGTINFKNNRYENAFDDLHKSILANPNNATYYHIRGDMLFQNEDFYSALHDFNTIINTLSLHNRNYFLSDSHQMRLLVYCCTGEWHNAKHELEYLPDDYIYYTKPIEGIINKNRIIKAINDKNINWLREPA